MPNIAGSYSDNASSATPSHLDRCNAIREQGDMEWRIVGEYGMEFPVMLRDLARHVEGRFHCGFRRYRETPAKRNMKDKIKIQVDGIVGRQIVEPVDWFATSFFNGLNERDNFVNR